MITENYVSFEIAKLLKEKGFDEGCSFVVNATSKGVMPVSWPTTNSEIEDDNADLIALPTLQMAMKWLRECNIDIDIDAHCGMLGIKCYVAYVSTYKPYKLTDTDKECGLTEDDVKHRQVQSKFNTRIPSKDELIPAHEYFESYEEACEAGLKYALENLI